MLNRNLVFNLHRFSVNEVLTEWEKADKSKDLVVLESLISDWSIEVDGIQSISRQAFESFLSIMDAFDNEVHFIVKKSTKKAVPE